MGPLQKVRSLCENDFLAKCREQGEWAMTCNPTAAVDAIHRLERLDKWDQLQRVGEAGIDKEFPEDEDVGSIGLGKCGDAATGLALSPCSKYSNWVEMSEAFGQADAGMVP